MRAVEELLPLFRRQFGAEPGCASFAPGRVNLIGEHTDYNKGYVLPIAIDLGVTILARKRSDRRLRVYAADREGWCEVDASRPIERQEEPQWANYVLGTYACVAEASGVDLPGIDLFFAGDVPIGGGLSSSAAVEVATATAICALAGIDMLRRDMAEVCQRAEHEYARVQCGIMDQFIATHGKRDHALLLDCRDLSYAMISMQVPGVELLVVHSGVSHGLHDSEYNLRGQQCRDGVQFLAQRIPRRIESLRDLTIDDLLAHHEKMDPVVVMRCRHVITENERVLKFAEALSSGDARRCGTLLYASHESLRQDYEVSCAELDTLVEVAMATRSVYGARMVGAGFGGCVLCMVAADGIRQAEHGITAEYRQRTGRTPTAYIVRSGDGGRLIPL